MNPLKRMLRLRALARSTHSTAEKASALEELDKLRAQTGIGTDWQLDAIEHRAAWHRFLLMPVSPVNDAATLIVGELGFTIGKDPVGGQIHVFCSDKIVAGCARAQLGAVAQRIQAEIDQLPEPVESQDFFLRAIVFAAQGRLRRRKEEAARAPLEPKSPTETATATPSPRPTSTALLRVPRIEVVAPQLEVPLPPPVQSAPVMTSEELRAASHAIALGTQIGNRIELSDIVGPP